MFIIILIISLSRVNKQKIIEEEISKPIKLLKILLINY